MPVLRCSGTDCRRMISVSAIAGGNPMARSDPEGFAAVYQSCINCGRTYCDRCVRSVRRWWRDTRCPECKHVLADPDVSRQRALRGETAPRAAAGVRREPSPRGPAPTSGAPRARSELEAGFYTELHRCPCGAGGSAWRTARIDVDDGPGLERTTTCGSCGRHRRFVFRGPVLPVSNRISFGPGTSDLIDAAEWLAVAEMAFNSHDELVDASPHGETVHRGLAAAAVREALAFIPPGGDRVADNAFWSERARSSDPATFTRAGLHALLRRYDPTNAPPPAPAPAPAPRPPFAPTSPAPVPQGAPPPPPPVLTVRPVRFGVPGRCTAGSFARDGAEIALACGFTRANGSPRGEVAVFATTTGRCLQRHEFDAYDVRLVHTTDGLVVADRQGRDGRSEPSALVRYTSGGREVLLSGVGVGAMVQTREGFAALTDQGEVVVGAGGALRVTPPLGPHVCLAADPTSGRLAVGGDRLVLADASGAVLVVGAVPTGLHHIVFTGPDRIVTADPMHVRLWRLDADAPRVVAETPRIPGLVSLVALPARGLVIGTDPDRRMWAAEVAGDSLRVVTLPAELHGQLACVSPTGDLLALSDGIDERPPPAPEAIEVHDTRAWSTS